MRHVRLGRLPKSRIWQKVVDLIANGADVNRVAEAAARASEKAFSTIQSDAGFREAVHQLTQLAVAAKKVITLAAIRADVRKIKQITTPLPGAINQLGKGVEAVRINTEAIARNEYELRHEYAELQRIHAEGYLKFTARVNANDFTAFIFIMTMGNRKAAADELNIPHRSFYDRVDKWREMGPEYKRMFRMVEWRKKIGRKIKVRIEDSLLSGEPNDQAENPETIRDVLTRIEDQEVDNRDYPDILRQILGVMSTQNPGNWLAVNNEVIGILSEELPQ